MEIGIWLEEHKLDFEWIEEGVIFSLDGKLYLVLSDKDIIINSEFNLEANDFEFDLIEGVDRVAFMFGEKWYWCDPNGDTKLNPLRYIGTPKENNIPTADFPFPYLGVHGKFELLNGSRDYKDWCRKAKFLGYSTLGVCEAQTLAGTMAFQQACKDFEMKSIIGHSALVKSKDQQFFVKLYAKNKTGWRNLLKINREQLVVNWNTGQHIEEDELMKYSEGLVCVLTPETKLSSWLVKKYKKNFSDCFYQLDLTEWKSDRKDTEWINSIQSYLSHFRSILRPVLINDSYYLDRIDSETKKNLNDIGKVRFQNQSDDQYMKSLEDIYLQFEDMFEEEDVVIFWEALENTCELNNLCDFEINTKSRYLPEYEMNHEEASLFSDNEELFWHKINKGLEEKILPKVSDDEVEVYLDRIEKEVAVLKKGGVVDYFLILSDVCEWCLKNGVLVGHGRGSAGGSLVSYLLNIIHLDPVEYNLLFERFLNEGRVLTSLPDIDLDFSDRDRVIEYVKEKYGKDYVASVATYGNLKVKNAIKDFSRLNKIDHSTANYITGVIDKDHEASDFTKFFSYVVKTTKLKNFVRKYPKVFKHFDLLLHQTRTASIHACATIIFPKKDEEGNPVSIHDLVPSKMVDGQLVTEWEGEQLEKAGFLKEDILGLKQLEKFEGVLKLIEKNTGEKIDLYEIDLEDKDVFEEFSRGLTEDVFQFGSDGLKSYCASLKPESIEELTAANSLYRPGAMESNAHTDFVKIKWGKKEPEFDYLLDEITKSTYGLYIYQEQIMQAYGAITGVSLIEADNFRKYITKAYKMKARGIVDTAYVEYEKKFVESYIEKGQDKDKAQAVWDKLVAFAGYGFNRSHSAAYSIIGYISQWFKVKYPLEFWTISLNEANDKERPKRLTELIRHSRIKIHPPDINKSGVAFQDSIQDNAIYWSLSSVKWLGEVATKKIIEEREKNGNFYSLEEFTSRLPKSEVNKRGVTNLILSGAFDETEKIDRPEDRFYVLDRFFAIIETDDIDKYVPSRGDSIFWELIQNQLTGFGDISFNKICSEHGFKDYLPEIETLEVSKPVYCTVAGIVEEVRIKASKKAGDFATITINSNNELIEIMCWNDCLENNREKISNCEGKVLILNGQVQYNDWSNKNIVYTNRTTNILIP